MSFERLRIHAAPKLQDGRMALAFSGWMDGGDVSTGTIRWLAKTLNAPVVGDIEPEGFYIYNFPGSMEVAGLFRPHTRIEDGRIKAYEPPANSFFCERGSNLVLFLGKEPNLNWGDFADCIFAFARQAGVVTLYFIGGVASAVPHTREPRLTGTASDEETKAALEPYGVSFTNYEGPAGMATYLIQEAPGRGLHMASLVVEIPAYIQGSNPKSLEAVIRKLAAILDLRISHEQLRSNTQTWEKRLTQALKQEEDLRGYIRKLEEDYDNEVFDTQMGDLKEWLQERGIRVD